MAINSKETRISIAAEDTRIRTATTARITVEVTAIIAVVAVAQHAVAVDSIAPMATMAKTTTTVRITTKADRTTNNMVTCA